MDKVMEIVVIFLATVLVLISIGISLIFLGWIWLGVESVWSAIF